jgi:hypothetical protein
MSPSLHEPPLNEDWTKNSLFEKQLEIEAKPSIELLDATRKNSSCVEQQSHFERRYRTVQNLLLEFLERLVIRSNLLQQMVINCHRRSFRSLLRKLSTIERVTIVGGGLFPRTALILRELLPDAKLTIVDVNLRNLERARRFMGNSVKFKNDRFRPTDSCADDLLVIPLSFNGDLEAIYRNPPARVVAVHDWIWNRRGTGSVVSVALLKRLNLVFGREASLEAHCKPRVLRDSQT